MKLLAVLALVILAGIYYYVALPALNIHSTEFWIFLIVVIVAAAFFYAKRKRFDRYALKESKGMKVILGILGAVVIVYAAGTLLSSPIVNAKKYQKLMKVEDGEFTKDIEELSFDQIPLLDRDSATILRNRKMGSMVDMVSQFEVDDWYSQIN